MTIDEALSGLGIPVSHPPYRGQETKYITFQIMGQESVLYADGTEQETAMRYSVDLYTSEPFPAMLPKIKAALEAAGYIAVVDQEIYESDTKLWHVAMSAVRVGADYGV